MPLISESAQKNKLKSMKINIKTKYIVGNNILERNTDDSKNDNIEAGVRCKKEYYLFDKLIHKENKFDTRIEYTYITNNLEDKEYTCPNCNYHGHLQEFVDGCPYCKTYYNMDYKEKDLGGKYHYDRVLRSTKYRVVTAIVDIIISIIAAAIFIISTARTFNAYDISKIFIYGVILASILYYFFYILDAYIVLGPIKKYKDKQNQKQIDFWIKTNINKKEFFNSFNYEIRNNYYEKSNIIDFDIIDFDDIEGFSRNGNYYIKVTAYIRVVTYEHGKITSQYKDEKFTFRQNKDATLELDSETNMIRCKNCGSSIDATKGKCVYCDTAIPSLQKWILEK